jgi:predicted DNA binding CopG/RHH family protein
LTVPVKYRYTAGMSPRQPHRVEVRFSDEEHALVARLAKEQGLQIATYLRWLVHQQRREIKEEG